MDSVREWKALALFVLCVAVIAAPAQTFTTLDTGTSSSAPLVQGVDGNLYGSYLQGDTIFKITPGGTLSTVHTFANEAGGQRPTGLALGVNGHLYGTTEFGGQSSTCPTPNMGCGTVFGFNANGTISTLHSFSGADGMYPVGGLTLGSDGNFYGTTKGIIVRGTSYGNVFKITPTGVFTVLHAFSNTDGANPVAPLVLGTNGNLYGTTTAGGTNTGGTVFMITTGGTLTTLHNFNSGAGGDGASPVGALVQAADGNFYGTALYGGPTCNGDVANLGTIFLISPGGRTFQTLYDFCTAGGASNPDTELVLGADGNFYGGTSGVFLGFTGGDAILFEITPEGALTSLYSFGYSTADLTVMQATNGTFYGTTTGSDPYQTFPAQVFSLSTGLGAFVTAVPPARGIGARVIILGQGLTGATSVTFNGVTAAFTVNSDTEITTSVPSGATTGSVQVTIPTGTLSTKVAFAVN
jgi:uncharacterized repeat protein (TIGR03803 family)